MLKSPKIILLDEPTKGLDAHFKYKLAGILHQLANKGITIIMVSHDIEFCAQHGDICYLFFGGNIVSSVSPIDFLQAIVFIQLRPTGFAGINCPMLLP